MNYYVSYHFMMIYIYIYFKKRKAFRGYAEAYKIIDNKSLSDLFYVTKNSIKNLFDELLREKKGF